MAASQEDSPVPDITVGDGQLSSAAEDASRALAYFASRARASWTASAYSNLDTSMDAFRRALPTERRSLLSRLASWALAASANRQFPAAAEAVAGPIASGQTPQPPALDEAPCEIDPFEWLQKHGFDSRNLCKLVPSQRNTKVTAHALWEASFEGNLKLCHWLYDHGAASMVRETDTFGYSPMYMACGTGSLDVAK